MIHIIKSKRNPAVGLRSKVNKRDKGICSKCGKKRKVVIRSSEDFDYVGYLTGTCKAEAASFITVCSECNAKMTFRNSHEGRVIPHLEINAEGQIIEFR